MEEGLFLLPPSPPPPAQGKKAGTKSFLFVKRFRSVQSQILIGFFFAVYLPRPKSKIFARAIFNLRGKDRKGIVVHSILFLCLYTILSKIKDE